MVGVEIVAVHQVRPTGDVLDGAHIERPAVHTHEGVEVLTVMGWAMAGASRAVAVEIVDRNRLIAVAMVDRLRRDVEAVHPGASAVRGFRSSIAIAELAPEFELKIRAMLEDGGRLDLGSIKGRNLGASRLAANAPGPHQEDISAVQLRLEGETERLIAAGLDSHDAPDPPDPACLDGLVLTGRRVLVIGTGLGEFARKVRLNGAGMVDVLEPDGDLAKLERLITAHRDVSRVFFFECDTADPSSYAGGYGVVMAPRGIEEIELALPRIAKTTKTLVTNLPLSRGKIVVPESLHELFPHHEPLGAEGASNGRSSKKSTMVALGTRPAELANVLRRDGPQASVEAAAR
jgi:predicted RNA methylase